MAKIAELRAAGQRVVCELSGQDGGAAAAGCQQVLVLKDGQWVVVEA
jgi:ATP phosphoribosyltransferase regulatory subunit